MIRNGDVFITKLERGFYGAFRVLKTGIYFDFSPTQFYLIAITNYLDPAKPNITDSRLRETLCEKRFSCGGRPHINIYSGQIIEKHFAYLGNIPLSRDEGNLPGEIGDGTGGGFPLVGAVQKDFGKVAFLEWRWQHEKEAMLQEQQHSAARQAALLQQQREIWQSCVKSTAQAYRCRDEKSDKFWRIESADCALAVNYGKTGSIGKYKLKQFENSGDCAQEGQRLIGAKLKKGYLPYPEFNLDKQFYFDDEEVGLHPLTSHPRFRAHFTERFYYDCSDEESPFGSDEGADALYIITKKLRRNPKLNFADLPRYIIEDEWGMEYVPAAHFCPEAVIRPQEADAMNTTQMITCAAAFGQIKITGRLDPALQRNALQAMQWYKQAAKLLAGGEDLAKLEKMMADLAAFETTQSGFARCRP